jgi:hypothetical protein
VIGWIKKLLSDPPPQKIAGPWVVGFSPVAVKKRLDSNGNVVSTLIFDSETRQYSGSRIHTWHSDIEEAKRLIDEATREAGWQLADEETKNEATDMTDELVKELCERQSAFARTYDFVKEQTDIYKEPYASLQWKGTDACMDLYCGCGAHFHIDDSFTYYVRCPHCKQLFAVGSYIKLVPLTDPEMVEYAESTSCIKTDHEYSLGEHRYSDGEELY